MTKRYKLSREEFIRNKLSKLSSKEFLCMLCFSIEKQKYYVNSTIVNNSFGPYCKSCVYSGLGLKEIKKHFGINNNNKIYISRIEEEW